MPDINKVLAHNADKAVTAIANGPGSEATKIAKIAQAAKNPNVKAEANRQLGWGGKR
ncbi:MAG TPA: hypothetical protein VGW74_09450 [Propionibacteriaceae bacterium]|nr:hypothetical protein [Propionibacteriaceae bacterium]